MIHWMKCQRAQTSRILHTITHRIYSLWISCRKWPKWKSSVHAEARPFPTFKCITKTWNIHGSLHILCRFIYITFRKYRHLYIHIYIQQFIQLGKIEYLECFSWSLTISLRLFVMLRNSLWYLVNSFIWLKRNYKYFLEKNVCQ